MVQTCTCLLVICLKLCVVCGSTNRQLSYFDILSNLHAESPWYSTESFTIVVIEEVSMAIVYKHNPGKYTSILPMILGELYRVCV